jgi:hypothetical protein
MRVNNRKTPRRLDLRDQIGRGRGGPLALAATKTGASARAGRSGLYPRSGRRPAYDHLSHMQGTAEPVPADQPRVPTRQRGPTKQATRALTALVTASSRARAWSVAWVIKTI